MTEQTTQQNDQPDIPALRQAAARSKELEQTLAERDRTLAFYRAGMNPEDPRVRYFVKGYEGDLSPDAIRKEATDAGFLAPPGPTPQQQQDLASQQRMTQQAASAQPEVQGQDQEAVLEQAFKEGGQAGLLAALGNLGIPVATGD